MNAGPFYSMPCGTTRYTTLCGVTSAADELQSSAAYHICVLTPNHTDSHMCECGREWHNQVGASVD
jgi:hypothetical protein